MKKNLLIKIAVIILVALLMVTILPKSVLGVTPDKITGEVSGDTELQIDFVNDIEDLLSTIGIFIAVGAMMVIGIRYMTGSIEEKANYKKTMMPYLIGCILLFGGSAIAPMIVDLFSDAKSADEVGNIALGVIQIVGTFMAVAVLMILGIKYMMGSVEERASYKKSMLPYLIGAVLVFSAVNLTAVIYDMTSRTGDEAYSDAMDFINKNKDDLDAIYDKAVSERKRANQEQGLTKEDQEVIRRTADYLEDYYRANKDK